MTVYRCQPVARPLDAVVTVPGSKSITNRALVTAALAQGGSILKNILLAEDTRLMIDCLGKLGVAITVDEAACMAEVTGTRGQIPALEGSLFCGNSGTTLRFCTALCATAQGRFRLDGIPRMRERPIGGLIDALRTLGSRIEFEEKENCPPLILHAEGLRGGYVVFDSPESSQFVSALLMAAPCALQDVFIEVHGQVASVPYIRTTLRVMEAFGIAIMDSDDPGVLRFIVEAPQTYQAANYTIEPDATSAMYFLAAAAVAGGSVTVSGLGKSSIQGDVNFVRVLQEMGCEVARHADELIAGRPVDRSLRGIDVDMKDMPDTVQTLAVLALFADSPTTIRGVKSLRSKETDRLAALENELAALGAKVQVFDDSIHIAPPQTVRPARIRTYDDHRMAMSFALVGLKVPGIEIENPECCAKTFPDYFRSLEEVAHQQPPV